MIMSELVAYGASLFDVKYSDIIADRRQPKYTHPRFAIVRALTTRGHSQCKIAGWIKHERTTIEAAIRRGNQLYESDPDFKFKTDAIVAAQMKGGVISSPHEVLIWCACYTGRTAGEVLASPFTEAHKRVFDTSVHLLCQMGYGWSEVAKIMGRDWQVVRRADVGYVNKWMDDKIAVAMVDAGWSRFVDKEIKEAAE